MAKTKTRVRGITVDTTVEIEPGDLYAEGWHHESECEVMEPAYDPDDPDPELMPFTRAVDSLHRQAHPSSGSITLCREEPCRWLSLEQLKQVGNA